MRRGLVLVLAWPIWAGAHPLAPALLELRESAPQRYEVLWRTAVARVRGVDLAPVLPGTCEEVSAPRSALRDGEALEIRWTVQCTEGLGGERIDIGGLQSSGINVVVRVEAQDGRVVSAMVDERDPTFTVPKHARGIQRDSGYLVLGVEHLLTGVDHLLFVVGLLLAVRGVRALIVAITAFTLGHSLTLGAATLGVARVEPALAELGIAVSLVAVALAILRPGGATPLLARQPGVLTFGFGLLHGLGFAGALSTLGLPQAEIVPALLAFNVGIELGQLAVVALALSLARMARPVRSDLMAARAVPAYIIGSLAACWCLERTAVLLG